MTHSPGDTLLNGQYRILGQIGRGGFGFVYKAQDAILRELVAIKELTPTLVGDQEILTRFLVEAKATMRLTHTRIVRTHNTDFQEYLLLEDDPSWRGKAQERLEELGAN